MKIERPVANSEVADLSILREVQKDLGIKERPQAPVSIPRASSIKSNFLIAVYHSRMLLSENPEAVQAVRVESPSQH